MNVKTSAATCGPDLSPVLSHLGCATREEAILKYYDLVKYTAYRLAARLPDNVCVDDLFNAGVIGLMDALDKFDPAQSVSFENYAKIRIRGAMLDEIRSLDWVPRSLRQKSAELEKTCANLEQRLGRFPEDEEIAREMAISLDEYHQLLDSLKGISFLPEDLNEYISENREAAHLATAPDEVFNQIHRSELQKIVAECIEGLTEKEKVVLSLYYFEELTMKEVGAVMGYTESRISQIHTKAILKLRTRLSKRLKEEDLPRNLSGNLNR
ncbi:RNA polymerase, sigma 28 subunit, SigD/FliA/WhiG [Desulfacinum hydrothermale DSM 13146]|uniref:RNA polymerase, sigma 28 subunit, SigD/FliA/WhiG n=1 Tax=Desulfacinum hydrothermale DSM 13146 TaxID=1121390 RepID=A0A1W1X612_9BACT|nr:FliA/WhiG family RNA polymerase sigma factor [Desulfacinum hydrothermale]SMC19365.1 RNA polymerase, sigma 28 subunit, SigD/FliA/WhiG [Desulfacinum hydrothermale DSM 13146]